eukprot:TRINITY_DN3456_c1_g1_i1.p1 TRINITY_DN3456_c1_g1~~TRINITY_DN3456_c1_g1_i1.p1  ORF type:complete len:1086 (-),score=191.48 TRINITY_DN3456_c1_g1_i1:89-3286(-)
MAMGGVGEAIAAAGFIGAELFNYNRKNFEFDNDQRFEREELRLKMQVERFKLFREDIRDLVELTVGKMDLYHLIGALFLKACVVYFCEGIIHGELPPYLLILYYLSSASAFVYLLLAIWLAMHASISSHSYGTRLLTRFVRLPIPSSAQMAVMNAKYADFERQGGAMLRVPLVQSTANKWTNFGAGSERRQRKDDMRSLRDAATGKMHGGDLGPMVKGAKRIGADAAVGVDLLGQGDPALGEDDELLHAVDFRSERHVQLFRRLQAKWQCFDAYARVCMALGMRQMLQGITFYLIGVSMVEHCSPSVACVLMVALQSAAALVTSLDICGTVGLCGNNIDLQIVGVLPSVMAFVSIVVYPTSETADEEAETQLRISAYCVLPTFFLQTCWFQLLLRVSAPTKDDAGLPRYWRSVLFMDVFTEGGDPMELDLDTGLKILSPEEKRLVGLRVDAAELQLLNAQSALRRWEAVPSTWPSREVAEKIRKARKEMTAWTSLLREELHRRRLPPLSRKLLQDDPWHAREVSEWREDEADQFIGTLLGPFEDEHSTNGFYWDIETGRSLYPGKDDVNAQRILTVGEACGTAKSFARSVERVIETARDRVGYRRSDGMTPGDEDDDDDSTRSSSSSSENDEDVVTPLTMARRFSSRFEMLKKKKAPVHVVPERLPWKLLLLSTRAIQLVWIFAGTMMFLRYTGVLVVDLQTTTIERRLLARGITQEDDLPMLDLESLDVSWPFGAFFRPGGLSSCTEIQGGTGSVLAAPQFLLAGTRALYETTALHEQGTKISLQPLPTPPLPVEAISICPEAGAMDAGGRARSCLLARPVLGGLHLSVPSRPEEPFAMLFDDDLEFERGGASAPRLLVGTLAPCGRWPHFAEVLARSGLRAASNASCVAVVRGDASGVVVWITALPEDESSMEALGAKASDAAEASQMLSLPLLPAFSLPLPSAGEAAEGGVTPGGPDGAVEAREEELPVAAQLSFGGEGFLLVLLLSSRLQLDVFRLASTPTSAPPELLRRWRLAPPKAERQIAEVSGLCLSSPSTLLLAGRLQGYGPRLWRAQLPANVSDP